MCVPQATRHTSIRYSSSCHTHTSTWVHRYSSLLQWSVPLGQRGHVGGSFACFARNARCTDLLVWYSNIQNDFFPGAAIFSLHTLASPSGRNVNYDEKQTYWEFFFLSCSFYLYRFRKYVSYGCLIINFCNPGVHVHYEMPSIWKRQSYSAQLWVCLSVCLQPHQSSRSHVPPDPIDLLYRLYWTAIQATESKRCFHHCQREVMEKTTLTLAARRCFLLGMDLAMPFVSIFGLPFASVRLTLKTLN